MKIIKLKKWFLVKACKETSCKSQSWLISCHFTKLFLNSQCTPWDVFPSCLPQLVQWVECYKCQPSSTCLSAPWVNIRPEPWLSQVHSGTCVPSFTPQLKPIRRSCLQSSVGRHWLLNLSNERESSHLSDPAAGGQERYLVMWEACLMQRKSNRQEEPICSLPLIHNVVFEMCVPDADPCLKTQISFCPSFCFILSHIITDWRRDEFDFLLSLFTHNDCQLSNSVISQQETADIFLRRL